MHATAEEELGKKKKTDVDGKTEHCEDLEWNKDQPDRDERS